MNISFEGKNVLVTGASTGIGAALARGFADADAGAAIHYHSNREAAAAIAAEIEAAGQRAVAVQADLAQPLAGTALIDEVEHLLGPIDVLVNKPGGLVGRYPTGTVLREQYEAVIELNFGSLVNLTNAVMPGIRQRKSAALSTSAQLPLTVGAPARRSTAPARERSSPTQGSGQGGGCRRCPRERLSHLEWCRRLSMTASQRRSLSPPWWPLSPPSRRVAAGVRRAGVVPCQ
jgi:NAD(P)-dependent dehydrogenase (short-subunit alcohol dehydrogenase family)